MFTAEEENMDISRTLILFKGFLRGTTLAKRSRVANDEMHFSFLYWNASEQWFEEWQEYKTESSALHIFNRAFAF